MIKCRIINAEDESRIRELLCNPGDEWLRDLDWSKTETWMGAELDGKLEALIQLCSGKPIAHLEHLIINEELNHIQRAKIVKILLLTSTAALRQTGAELAAGSVQFKHKGFKKLLKKRGGFVVTQGNMIATRLK